MTSPVILKIDVTKLRKEWLFKGKSGTYADLVLYYNDEPDKYGNECAIKQNPPKEARDAGEKGHYVGNGKLMPDRKPRGDGGSWNRQESKPKPAERTRPPAKSDGWDDDSEPPF